MKNLLLIVISLFTTTYAKAQFCADCGDVNKATGAGITIIERGEGLWVCSAKGPMKDLPVLGRGLTKLEAEANAKSLASAYEGSSFSVNTVSCENSYNRSPSISISNTGNSINIKSGTPSVQCVTTDNMNNVTAIASADTGTEAKALSIYACSKKSGNSFFCETKCSKISDADVTNDAVNTLIDQIIDLFK